MPDPKSKIFRELADKIDRNDEKDFAGAFLVVPPIGDPISAILVGDAADIASFFGMLKTKLDVAVNKIAEEEKKKLQPFGHR